MRTAICVLFGACLVVAAVSAPAAQQPSMAIPTFSKDAAPIVFNKCASCHRPGEVAPMSLTSYKEVRPWASAIKQKVVAREMPPWDADPHFGKFRNDLSLTDREIDTLVRWVDGGAREGDPAALPALPKFPDGWQIGTPDVVFEMQQEFEIPARAEIDYQYFEVPTNFTEDKWMQAGEVRAGDRAHVHHVIVSVREPKPVPRPSVVSIRALGAPAPRPAADAAAPPSPSALPRVPVLNTNIRRAGGGDSTLVNWAVGEDAPVFLPGLAKRIPAGSTLVFQVHYTTNGTPGKDRSKIGIIFAKEPPQREIRTGMIVNTGFAIPAGEGNHKVEAEATFSENVKIWSMHPHMHYRGKDMTYTATYPDGRTEIILKVPQYNFGWQTDYWLAEPLVLPKGSKVHVAAHFDNSAANRANPDPKAVVRWGDQTWEEMMIGYFTYTVEPSATQSASR